MDWHHFVLSLVKCEKETREKPEQEKISLPLADDASESAQKDTRGDWECGYDEKHPQAQTFVLAHGEQNPNPKT